MSHHPRTERMHILAVAQLFLENNPPRMPENFTHAEWKRITKYAIAAFRCGYCTAENDLIKGRELKIPKKRGMLVNMKRGVGRKATLSAPPPAAGTGG